jgi:hypothetical protein
LLEEGAVGLLYVVLALVLVLIVLVLVLMVLVLLVLLLALLVIQVLLLLLRRHRFRQWNRRRRWSPLPVMTDNNLFCGCSSLADTTFPAINPKVMGRAFPIFG